MSSEQPSYVNAGGTIYKVKGGKPLEINSPTEQRKQSLCRFGFMALRAGFSRRQHLDRLEAKRQKALTAIREARKVSGQVIANVGDRQVPLTATEANILAKHLDAAGEKLRQLAPKQKESNEHNREPNTQPS